MKKLHWTDSELDRTYFLFDQILDCGPILMCNEHVVTDVLS